MRAWIEGTWLATAMFVTTTVGFGLWSGSLVGVGGLTTGFLLITPPIWWWAVARRRTAGPGSGAVAGAACAAIVFAVPVLPIMMGVAQGGPGEELAALATMAGITVLMGLWAGAIVVGAAVGLVAALLQKRWLVRRVHRGAK